MERGNFKGESGGPLKSIATVCREHCNKSSAVAEMGHRLATRHGPKRGGLLCPFRGELGPHLTQCGRGQGLPLCQISS